MKLPERDTSTGSSALLAALVVLALIITTVYYREADTGPVHSLRRGVKAMTAPIASGGEVITRPFRSTADWFSGFGVRREELEVLSAQNAELRATVAELEEARQENERLTDLIGFVEAREFEAVGAHVIGRPATSWEHVFTIDRGTDDGIEIGMPVLGANGLLGQTVLVTGRSATVRLLSDRRSGVAALLQGTRAEGIVSGAIDGPMELEFVSVDTTVTIGDVVLTSGLGGVYPKGLLIGEVSSTQAADNDLFQRIQLLPAATLKGIEEVVVLVGAGTIPDLGGGE